MKRISAALLVALCACGPGRTITLPDGRTIPYEDAAREPFEKARALEDAGRTEEAAKAYADFLRRFPDSERADEAMFRRAQLLERLGKFKEAEASLQELLEKRPTSSYRRAAAVELGLVQAKLGNNEGAAQSLKPMVDQMSEAEKRQAAAVLSQAFQSTGDAGEAARWAARAVEAAPEGPEREARMKEFLDALESSPGSDVARLVSELDRRAPTWPPAALRLARIQAHTGDRVHAADLASDVVSLTGGAGPWGRAAQAFQKSLQTATPVKPNLIGVVLPLSGDPVLKGFADQVLNAIALTFDLQNRGPIHVSVKDSKGEADGAADAVEDLYNEGAIVVLGPIGLVEGPAAATRAQQLGIPLVSLSRAENLTAIGPFIFRDMPTSSAQARAIAEYAQKKLGAKAFGILQPDSTYGEEMSRHFWDAVETQGGEIRAYEHYPLRTTTFKPFVQRMVGRSPEDLEERKEFSDETEKISKEISDPYRRRKALQQLRNLAAPVVDFDALFVPDSARTVRLIAPAVAAEDVITTGCDTRELEVVRRTTRNEQLHTVQLLGTSLWDSPELVDERSGVARYVQCSVFVDVFFAGSERPATRKFVDEYAQTYQRQPGFLEAHAFDAASILKRTVERGRPQSREQLRDQLISLSKPFEGAAGDTVFGKDREAQKPFFWLWVNRGTIVEFDPEGTPPVPPASAPRNGEPVRPTNRGRRPPPAGVSSRK